MTRQRMDIIAKNAAVQKRIAEHIVYGEHEPYEGTDAPQIVRELCCQIEELIHHHRESQKEHMELVGNYLECSRELSEARKQIHALSKPPEDVYV